MHTLVQKHHENIVGQIDKAFTNLQGKVLSICPRRKNWPETNLIKSFWPWSPLSDEPLPWGSLRQHWRPSPKMYTFMVLAGADTTLEKPATVKTKSCRSPVSRARGKGIRPPSCLVGRGVDRERGVQCRVDEHQLVTLAA